MSASINTRSGIEINPVSSINDLLSGTSFQGNKEVQGYLQRAKEAFHEIMKTEKGQVLLESVKGLAREIRSEGGFRDAVKVCFRLAKKIIGNSWVQFGMFLGLFGLLVALIGNFGPPAVLGASLTMVMRQLGVFILGSALMSVAHGVQQSVDKFMSGSEEFADKK